MDNKEFAKAICMDCPNIFSYFQSLIEHPLFLSAVSKAYHEQWLHGNYFLVLEGNACSGKSTFSKFLRSLKQISLTGDYSLSDFMVNPNAILAGDCGEYPVETSAIGVYSLNLYIDGYLSRNAIGVIHQASTSDVMAYRRPFQEQPELSKLPLLILHTQRRLTEIESEGLARRQLILNFQPIARPIHNYLEHQQISYEIPAFLNRLQGMSKDDCLAILTTADRNLLTAK